MISVQTYQQLGYADHGWLAARHHFSFADYQNPERMGFGTIRVINDDLIEAGGGFDMHPHRNMEIITYVRRGAITHKDNKGNHGRTAAGDIQVMSAGKGIYHSEYNLEDTQTSLYQIWIEPTQSGVTPRWETAALASHLQDNRLTLLVSGDGQAPLSIHSQAKIYAGQLDKGTRINHAIEHQAYVLVSAGKINLDGTIMHKGDGAEVTDQDSVTITTEDNAEVLLLDVPAA